MKEVNLEKFLKDCEKRCQLIQIQRDESSINRYYFAGLNRQGVLMMKSESMATDKIINFLSERYDVDRKYQLFLDMAIEQIESDFGAGEA